MKKNKSKEKMKTDRWNEIIKNREEKKTKAEDDDWDKKENEERDDHDNDFHEEVYDSS